MTPLKGPGEDGFHAGFYQKSWNVIGDSLFNLFSNFVDSGTLRQGSNDTLLALIPKVLLPGEDLSVPPHQLMQFEL